MILTLRNFPQTVQDAAAAAQAACSSVLDFTTGSIERVLLEASAAMVLWLHLDALQVLSATRLSSSSGVDVDTFVQQFPGISRLPAVAAKVLLTFARANPTGPGTVTPGNQVKTADATVTFTVATDPTNPLWNGTAYVMPPGTASIVVPAMCAVTGQPGNVAVGSVALLAGAFSGVDTVTNAVAGVGGIAVETDTALKARFPLYIASIGGATDAAILFAAYSVQQGITVALAENSPRLGSFVVTVDDGTGSPSAALLAAVSTAVNLVRPIGSTAAVFGPTVVGVTVSVVLALPATTIRAPVVALVGTAISAYVAGLPVGVACSFARLGQVVFDAVPGILNANILLNAGTADVVPGVTGVCRSIIVSVS